jgi:hypothetical protein
LRWISPVTVKRAPGDGLETVEEQRVEAAVNLPQGDLIGRPDQQLVNDRALEMADLQDKRRPLAAQQPPPLIVGNSRGQLRYSA